MAQLVETLDAGGAERLALQIAGVRAAAGDVSHLYVLGGPGELSPRVASDVRVRYLRLARASIDNPLAFLASVRGMYAALRRQLTQDGISVLQTHLPEANFWGLLLAWRGACVVVPTVHSTRDARYGERGETLKLRLRRWAYRQMTRRCGAVVAVSEEVRRSLVEFTGLDAAAAHRIEVIANGVELPEPIPAALVDQVRGRYGLPPGDPLVLAAGRLVEAKNFPALLEATLLLRRRGVRLRVMIAGDGPLRPFLARRVEELGLDDQVLLPGVVSDLTELMQGAAVFVMPSLWEGLPLALLEAMAAGLPVVGTRIHGIAEVVQDGVSGLLVAPGDVPALADAIATLLSDAGRRASCGAAGRRIVQDSYSLERTSQALGELYARLTA